MNKFLRNPMILLHARKMYEADLNVVLFSANYGKIDARAKSVRRPKSKLRTLNSPLATMIIELNEGKKIPTITGVKMQKSRQEIAENLECVRAGMALCELAEKLTKPYDPHPELFKILEKKLDALTKTQNPDLVCLSGILQILQNLGFLGEIKNCVNCGKKISEGKIYFAPNGLSCANCETLSPCPLNLAKVILFASTCHESDLNKIKISTQETKTLLTEVQNWVIEITGKKLRSLY